MVVTIELIAVDPYNIYSPKYRTFRIDIGNTHTIMALVTSEDWVVERWISRTLEVNNDLYHTNRLVMGRAIRPTPVSGNHIPATITLCVRKSCLVYHNRHNTTLPNVLNDFIGDPRINFVSVWLRHPPLVSQLRASNPWLSLLYNRPIDVSFFIRDHQGNPVTADFGIYHVATELLGLDIQPELRDVENSNWRVMELTNDQIAQASLDAFVPREIGTRARIWNVNFNLYFFRLILMSIIIHSLGFL